MAGKAVGSKTHRSTPKKTKMGGKHSMIKTSSMSKTEKRSYKKYRGQGR